MVLAFIVVDVLAIVDVICAGDLQLVDLAADSRRLLCDHLKSTVIVVVRRSALEFGLVASSWQAGTISSQLNLETRKVVLVA